MADVTASGHPLSRVPKQRSPRAQSHLASQPPTHTGRRSHHIIAMTFSYYSAELHSQLGLPDHPAIQLAVATVANQLAEAAARAHANPGGLRIAVTRAASYVVLWSWPIEAAQRYAADEGLDLVHEVWWPEERLGVRPVDRLGQATERLRSEGIDPVPDARHMKTRYGWSAGALTPDEG